MDSILKIRTILEIAAENTLNAIAISDVRGILLYVNKAFITLWGYESKEQVLGRNALEFWSTKEDAKKVMETMLTTGTYLGELEGVKKDKTNFVSLVSGTISKTESGEVEFLLASFLDISVIKQLTEALSEKENYYSQILDSISDLIFCKNSELKITYVNKACANHFGQKKSEIIGSYDTPKNKQEFIEEYHKIDSTVIKERKQIAIEREPHIGTDGLVRYFNTVKTPIHDNFGNVNELVAVARDITDSENLVEKLKLVTEITSDYIYTAKVVNGEIIADWSSDNLSQIIGYNVGEIRKIGGWINLIYKEDLKIIGERVSEIVQGKTGVVEYRVHSKSGGLVWIRDYSKPLKDHNGNITSIIGASKNITIEKETELKYQETSERFLASMEASLESIYFLATKKDTSGEIIDFVIKELNSKAIRELGLPRSQLIGKGICELFPINMENGFFEQYKKVVKTQTPLEQEYLIPDGYHSSGYFYHQVLPTTDGIVIYNRDISDRKAMEELLLTTNRLAKVGGWEYIFASKELNLSRVAMELLEFETQSISPFEFEDFLPDDFKLPFSESITDRTKLDEPFDIQTIIKTKSGLNHWFRLIGKPKFKKETHIGFYGAIQNIHEQKITNDRLIKNKEELRLKNKELESLIAVTNRQNDRLKEYTYITSHNLRAPIANILSLSTLLRDDPSDLSLVQMIETSAQQLDQMIKNLNELLNIEKDSYALIKKNLNIKEEIQKQLSLFFFEKNKKAKINVNISNEEFLNTIPAYFESILGNLISNAIKYLSPEREGVIHIETKHSEEFVVIQVSDNGVGMDLTKNRSRLFKMNARFHPNIEGKGMGLFLTKYQIESLGGKIEVESKQNEGTIFSVYFPK